MHNPKDTLALILRAQREELTEFDLPRIHKLIEDMLKRCTEDSDLGKITPPIILKLVRQIPSIVAQPFNLEDEQYCFFRIILSIADKCDKDIFIALINLALEFGLSAHSDKKIITSVGQTFIDLLSDSNWLLKILHAVSPTVLEHVLEYVRSSTIAQTKEWQLCEVLAFVRMNSKEVNIKALALLPEIDWDQEIFYGVVRQFRNIEVTKYMLTQGCEVFTLSSCIANAFKSYHLAPAILYQHRDNIVEHILSLSDAGLAYELRVAKIQIRAGKTITFSELLESEPKIIKIFLDAKTNVVKDYPTEIARQRNYIPNFIDMLKEHQDDFAKLPSDIKQSILMSHTDHCWQLNTLLLLIKLNLFSGVVRDFLSELEQSLEKDLEDNRWSRWKRPDDYNLRYKHFYDLLPEISKDLDAICQTYGFSRLAEIIAPREKQKVEPEKTKEIFTDLPKPPFDEPVCTPNYESIRTAVSKGEISRLGPLMAMVPQDPEEPLDIKIIRATVKYADKARNLYLSPLNRTELLTTEYLSLCFYSDKPRWVGGEQSKIVKQFTGYRAWEEQDQALSIDALTLNEYSLYGFNVELFNKLLPIMIQAASLEAFADPMLFAYKVSVLFDNFGDALEYLTRYQQAHPNSHQPVHDACLFTLPQKGLWQTSVWAQLVLGDLRISKVLPFAPRVEVFLRIPHGCLDAFARKMKIQYQWEHNKVISKLRHQAKGSSLKDVYLPEVTLQSLQKIIAKWQYPNAHENLAMATLFSQYFIPQEIFEEGLGVWKERSLHDCLPNIEVTGTEIGLPAGLKLIKLPPSDLRALVLGHETGCCQSIGSDASTATINAIQSSYQAFYVVVNSKGGILTQALAWISKEGNIVFDSIESKIKTQAIEHIKLFAKAGEKMLGTKIELDGEVFVVSRVTVGQGGGTPRTGIHYPVCNPQELPYDGEKYGDADRQLTLATVKPKQDFRQHCLSFTPSKHKLKTLPTQLVKGHYRPPRNFEEVSILVCQPTLREKFWRKHPLTLALLLADIRNPIVIENDGSNMGEYRLSFDALKILITVLRRKAESRPDYNTMGLALIDFDQSLEASLAALQKLDLSVDGQDAKIIIQKELHMTSVYIRNIGGVLHMFLHNAIPTKIYDYELARQIVQAFSSMPYKILQNTHRIQYDVYSGPTLALNMVKYFCKYGATLFDEISAETYPEGVSDLPLSSMPARLLKFSQPELLDPKNTTINADVMNRQKVKTNPPLCLRDYIQHHCVQHQAEPRSFRQRRIVSSKKGDIYNAASLRIRYQQFDTLEGELVRKMHEASCADSMGPP